MATVTFKGKVKTVYYVDDTKAYDYIQIPVLTRGHCDMKAFRKHSKLGSYANSDMFLGILERQSQSVLQYDSSRKLRLHNIPDGVKVDSTGFLTVVSFEL
jgi:hypothetical protein